MRCEHKLGRIVRDGMWERGYLSLECVECSQIFIIRKDEIKSIEEVDEVKDEQEFLKLYKKEKS